MGLFSGHLLLDREGRNHWAAIDGNRAIAGRKMLKRSLLRDFPSGPVVKRYPSTAGHMGSVPHLGTKTLHATRHGQKIEGKKEVSYKWNGH